MNKGKNSSLNNKDKNELTRTMCNAILAGQFSEKHQMNPKHKTHGSSFASGHKVYKCESCGKSFSQKRYLQKHIYTVHEDNKHYNCKSCDKSFTYPYNLKKHIQTVHEGHKDYKCETCGKSFSKKENLKKHIHTIHAGSKDHKYESCHKLHTNDNKCYPSGNSMDKLKETNTAWINCDKCNKSFGKANFLKNHIVTVHEGQKQEQQSNALMPDNNKLHKCKSSDKSLNRFTHL